MSSEATYELEGHIATITCNRPESLNAVNADLRRCLNEAFARVRDEEDAWVAIVTGAGRLPQKSNWQFAMELLFTGERIGAERAKEVGLVGWVVAHDQLMAEARLLAERLLAAAPLAARAIKEVAARSQGLSPVDAIRFGETMRIVAAASEDATERWQAAREGRPPRWPAR